MAELKLYNTLTRTKEAFVPLDPANVRMYVCGPTVYDFAHIGNARPVIVFDVLFRLLKHLYPGPGKASDGSRVTYARNITDVDDKINDRAVRDYPGLPLNEAIRKVTEGTNAQFQADVKALGCLEPTYQPRATEYLDEMRGIIERLVAKGFAYVAEEHVLFSPTAMDAANGRLPRYGKLANRSLDEMIAGARVDVAPYKREATDFVLWKPSDPGQPGWPSPCGIKTDGRPGWHIECSAMSMAKLLAPFGGGLTCDDPVKNTFDIHGGGIDLVFPHHENEIAQSCCAFGSERMANIWMHNGFLQVEGQKMSKSLGNFVTINELLEQGWDGRVLRLLMLKTHYRQPIDWTRDGLMRAAMELDKFSRFISDADHDPKIQNSAFMIALEDDLNTPLAISELHAIATRTQKRDSQHNLIVDESVDNAYAEFANALCLLGLSDVKDFDFNAMVARLHYGSAGPDTGKINALITARLAARNAKNFAESDRIRDELVAMGIQIMDAKDRSPAS